MCLPATPQHICKLGTAYEYKDSTDSDEEGEELAGEVWGLHLESEEEGEEEDDWEGSEFGESGGSSDADGMEGVDARDSPVQTEADSKS